MRTDRADHGRYRIFGASLALPLVVAFDVG